MSDLTVDTKRTFGKYLPTATIKGVVIDEHINDKMSTVEISVDVNFTIDKDIKNYQKAVAANYDDLYLYIIFCKNHIINSMIYSSNLDLRDIFKFNRTLATTISVEGLIESILLGTGYSATEEEAIETFQINIKKVSLKDLKNKIVEDGLYDINGDRILKISNIKMKTNFIDDIMADAASAMAIAFVGRDEKQLRRLPEPIYKRNFGDLSYELSLSNNKVPDTTENIYVDINNNQYNGTPIQTVGGRYHVPEPISHAEIVDMTNQLMSSYASIGETSAVLSAAFTNLSYILATQENSEELLLKMNLFRKGYPDKSNSTVAGRFYDLFKRKLFQWNRSLLNQPRLYKRLIINSKTIDIRGRDMEIYSLYIPEYATGMSYDSDYYINNNMININRTTQLTIPLEGAVSDYVQFVAEEGALYSQALWNKTYDQNFANSLDETYMASGYDTSADGIVPNQIVPLTDTDTVVKNKGLFFFDLERALHTKSQISKVFRIHYLQRFLGLQIPYKLFSVSRASIERTEKTFTTQNEEEGDWRGGITIFEGMGAPVTYNENQVTMKMNATFYTDSDYPKQWSSDWSLESPSLNSYMAYGYPYIYKYVFGGVDDYDSHNSPNMNFSAAEEWASSVGAGTTGEELDEARDDAMMKVSSYNGTLEVPYYATEYVAMANEAATEAKALSYLKFKNFDLPFNDSSNRLDGYNGPVVRNGYRLMCFEFQDFMDDDVAYYNTIGTHHGDRESWWTDYRFEVDTLDNTYKIYNVVKKLLEREYGMFMEYYLKAIEACSYNNIEGVFNEFFISAMTELEASGALVAWYRAPFIYNSAMAVLTNKYDGIFSMSDIANKILEDSQYLAGRLSPMSGNMREVNSFKEKFEHLLGMFNSSLIPLENRGPNAGAVYDLFVDVMGTEPTNYKNVGQRYTRNRDITEDIYGNLYLSAWTKDDIYPGQVSGLIEDTTTVPDAWAEAAEEEAAAAEARRNSGADIGVWTNDWTDIDTIEINAGRYDEDLGYVAAGSEWEEGALVTSTSDSYSGLGVYLQPGTYTIWFKDSAGDARTRFVVLTIEEDAESPNRVKRYTGAGAIYTHSGVGRATISWPYRKADCGGTDSYVRFTNNYDNNQITSGTARGDDLFWAQYEELRPMTDMIPTMFTIHRGVQNDSWETPCDVWRTMRLYHRP